MTAGVEVCDETENVVVDDTVVKVDGLGVQVPVVVEVCVGESGEIGRKTFK